MKNIVQKMSRRALRLGSGILPPPKSPDESLGRLFHDVQMKRLFPDSYTFANAMPKKQQRQLIRDYEKASKRKDFDLQKFVEEHFETSAASVDLPPVAKVEEHINRLWNILTREAPSNKGSMVALPGEYIVPGGRFQEQFYWDSYFVMVGLAASGRWDLVESIFRNATFMILKIGFVPTANRSFFLSRSQPPFFVDMVELIASRYGARRTYIPALPFMLKEYQFWMNGALRPGRAGKPYRRIVTMPDGVTWNRYYDDKDTPRPESYGEDVETAASVKDRASHIIYRDIRAAAESGWDFTSRWLADGRTLKTIHTTDIIPVDLNCLLYQLEMAIARTYDMLKQSMLANLYRKKASRRAAAIMKYCWNESDGYFYDYDFVAGKQTPVQSLAGCFVLYAGCVDEAIAGRVAHKLENDFLKHGGLVSTLEETGQQWDAPNGWAPLQWVAVQGLRNYGYDELADKIRDRWCALNLEVFKNDHKLVEKYNVVDSGRHGGGGEYPLQDGFGWTNGVLMAFLKEKEQDKEDA